MTRTNKIAPSVNKKHVQDFAPTVKCCKMRFGTKLKKKTSKKLTGERSRREIANKYNDDLKINIKISFKECKYAKFVPSDIKLEDNYDLVSLHTCTNDRKLDRSEHLQTIAKFIFARAYCSRSISASGILNLNKRVKRVTENYRTDKTDIEAMQIFCMCRDFQKVIKRTINDPSFKKKRRTNTTGRFNYLHSV